MHLASHCLIHCGFYSSKQREDYYSCGPVLDLFLYVNILRAPISFMLAFCRFLAAPWGWLVPHDFFSPPFHYWRWAEGTGQSHGCFVYFSTASMELLYPCSFRHVGSSSFCYAQVSRLSVCSRTAHTTGLQGWEEGRKTKFGEKVWEGSPLGAVSEFHILG